MILRGYQNKAVDGVFSEWEKVAATLGVAATGSGKTQIFCEVIRRRQPGRCLILAHRKELVAQAVNRLASFGMAAEIEQGELVASTSLFNASPVVVATPQTLYHGNFARLKRFNPQDFSTLICDEAHHYSGAPSFEAVVKHFKQNQNLKLLGVTATPDRTDNIAMAKIFDSVAFDIEITDLIQLGYLVDIDQRMVKIESLDFSECRKTAGDLNGADLARVMEFERTLLGMADATMATVGDKRTVVFAASVKQAERLAEIFNRHKSQSADCVFGHTTPEKRTEVLKRFSEGQLQICVNVGVLTEGYDNPGIESVVMARGTLSRALYAQMAGRGTRPLPGIVESVLLDDSALRRQAISGSSKPSLLLLDFVGNSGRHKLVTSADILGGKVSEEARERARKKIEKKGAGNMLEELDIAEKELRDKEEADRRRGLVAKAKFNLHYVDPFDMFKKRAEKWKGHVQAHPLTDKQRGILARNGYNPDEFAPAEGQAIITNLFRASEKQVAVLVRAGYPREEVAGIQKWEAAKLITTLANNGWRRPTENAQVTPENGKALFKSMRDATENEERFEDAFS